MSRRIHVFGLPHTTTDGRFPSCAYTGKVERFCAMMWSLGHEVFLYAGEFNSAPCTEHIAAFSEAERRLLCQDGIAGWTADHPAFRRFNEIASIELSRRVQPQDMLCFIGGNAHMPIFNSVSVPTTPVEFGVGYAGVFAKHRVFESYAWMHAIYGAADYVQAARYYDAVIPNYYDTDLFHDRHGQGDERGEYLLFVGRIIERKGILSAIETAKRTGIRLVVAGSGDVSLLSGHDCVEYVGSVGVEARSRLMGGATALLCPTMYVGPFEGVHAEAQLCGTPVITTDWGVFTETVAQGVNGWRCRDLGEFAWAAKHAPMLDRAAIRTAAQARYGMDEVRHQYEGYFKRLDTLWGEGWYTDADADVGRGSRASRDPAPRAPSTGALRGAAAPPRRPQA